MKLKLKHKIMFITTLAGFLPFLVILVLTNLIGSKVNSDVDKEIRNLTVSNISQIAKDVYSLCETSNNLLLERVSHNLNVLREEISLSGGIKLKNQKVNWNAINQYTKDVKSVQLPKLTIGNEWLGKNIDFSVDTYIVDDVANLIGGTITIFQRINEDGDMLRVATNVKKLDGTRAIGTYIPAVNPNGKGNPVVSKVMQGEIYSGRAFVVNAWYITVYEPIHNDNGDVIGMLYAGIQQDGVISITKAIENIIVGKTGGVYVYNGKGNDAGKFIISKDSRDKGNVVWDYLDEVEKDSLYNYFDRIALAKPGSIITSINKWKISEELSNKNKQTAFTYFAPWDWVIVSTALEEDFDDIHDSINSSLNSLLVWTFIGGIAIFIITMFVSSFIGNKIAKPISSISDIAQQISRGELLQAKVNVKDIQESIAKDKGSFINKFIYNESDETNTLLRSISNMTEQLNSLLGQVKSSSFLLSSTSGDISATSKQQEATITEFNATTNEVATASKEISATSKDLLSTMNQVSDVANNTKTLADEGKNSIDEMETSIENLVSVTEAISNKLNLINDNAKNISDIIITITKLADQTNLLSLNAAIEAEKAGKYGKGFSVVAKEIRRLADQTAVATLDIENMIKEMQESVTSGVNEMDRFFVDVKSSVTTVNKVSDQLERIIFNVQDLLPQFIAVNEGMTNQSQGAEQINEAIIQLSSTAEETNNSIKGFNKVTEQLNDAVKNLEKEIQQFESN